MCTNDRKYLRILGCLGLAIGVWIAGGALSTPALAQTICNSSLIIGFPNGDNLNRVVGQTVRMSLTITNFPSQDAGVPDSQTFAGADFFPSCLSVAGGVCTLDPGAVPGAPPAIQYAGNLMSLDCPTLPGVNAADPFDVKFTFAPNYTFANGAGCTFAFDVTVMETGSDGSPANISQLASTNGVCGSSLTSSQSATAAITLTCPVCDDGDACNGIETCNAATAACVPGTPLTCDDVNACTVDSCNPATGCVFTPRPPSFCDDSNACTDDACVPATGCVNTPKPPSFCDDSNACTDDACVPATGCVNTPKPPSFCDDSNACTDDACVPATGCTNTPKPPSFCNDSNACTDDVCVPATGCVNTPKPPSFCDDNNGCTDDACVPATGCVNTPKPPSFCDDTNGCTDDACIPATGTCSHIPKPPSYCDDSNVCTDDACVPATGGCSNTPKPPDFCNDNDTCTDDVCDPQDGCLHPPADPQPAGCGDAICRTPGFWGTHAGVEKKNSTNITEAVIDCADGNCANHTANDYLLICGEKIDSPDSNPADGTTDWNDAASSTEAMCMTVKGFPKIQLARQLTAAALNCLISGGGADCAGTGLYSTVFAFCNSKCSSGTATKGELTGCVGALDCLNNGNNYADGVCTPGGVNNCHDRVLVNEDLGLDFDPPGPAGSSDACNAANGSICAVLGPTEGPPYDTMHCYSDSLP